MGAAPPEGFERVPEGQGFPDLLAPLYERRTADGPQFGFYVEKHHLNTAGVCHGGMLISVMDKLIGQTLLQTIEGVRSAPTVQLSFDILSSGLPGDWLETEVTLVHTTSTLGFVNALLNGPKGVVVRASGISKLRRRRPRDRSAS
jgi:acyl-coenzyme A thioesterase PaaI-like protein